MIVFGRKPFGYGIFGTEEDESRLSITYGYEAKSEIKTYGQSLFGEGVFGGRKTLISLVGELPYRFTLGTSQIRTIRYDYTHWINRERNIPYSYKGYTIRIRTIRYGYRSLELFNGTVRKITITATPNGQVAKIELERR